MLVLVLGACNGDDNAERSEPTATPAPTITTTTTATDTTRPPPATTTTTVVAVPTATTQTFRLKVVRFASVTGTVSAFGAMSAVTATFGSTGSNVLGGSSSGTANSPVTASGN